jgi:hypothetical protein
MKSSGRINHNLGNWKSFDNCNKSCIWKYYFQPSTSRVYYQDENHYISIETDKARKTNAQILPNAQRYRHEIMPNDCIPAEIFSNRKNSIKSVKFSSSSTIYNSNNQQKGTIGWIQ